jgi:hypothetical protein
MKFDWDAKKAAANIRKHGVSFEEASGVFYDPFQLSRRDEAHSIVEDRWITIGTSNRLRVLIVVSTEREDDLVWIISARKANRAEVSRYEEAQRRASRRNER